MSKIRVLIVEDERIVAQEIEYALDRMGYEIVDIISKGEQAIQVAGETKPDLILMDIRLEGDLDGVEAANRIRDEHHLPVIFLTAFADEETLQRAKISEAYGYILKPFRENELHTAIEMALYKADVERQLKENRQRLTTTLLSINAFDFNTRSSLPEDKTTSSNFLCSWFRLPTSTV